MPTRTTSQSLWFWTKTILFIGVVGSAVYTGSGYLLGMAFSTVFPAEFDNWNSGIRTFGGFAIWFFYGRWVWKKLTSPKSASRAGNASKRQWGFDKITRQWGFHEEDQMTSDEGNELEKAVPQTSEEGALLDSANSQVNKEGSGDTEEHSEAEIETVKPKVGFAGKRVLLSIIGVVIILWVALFVSSKWVLVWEDEFTESQCQSEKEKKRYTIKYKGNSGYKIVVPLSFSLLPKGVRDSKLTTFFDNLDKDYGCASLDKICPPMDREYGLSCNFAPIWSCNYFNGRRLIRKTYPMWSYASCPNFLD